MLCCGRRKEIIQGEISTQTEASQLLPQAVVPYQGVPAGTPPLQGSGYPSTPPQAAPLYGEPMHGYTPGTSRRVVRRINGNGFDMGIKSIELFEDYTMIETIEITKRPGQTLGFYIREGNGVDRTDGVFISRIAPGGIVERNGLLRTGEEIIAVDSTDITRMSLDDVVMLISIPRRLLLTVRTKKSCCKNVSMPALTAQRVAAVEPEAPVYVRRGVRPVGGPVTSSVGDVMGDVYVEDVRAREDWRKRGPGGQVDGIQPDNHEGETEVQVLNEWYQESSTDRDGNMIYRELPRRGRRRNNHEHRSWERPSPGYEGEEGRRHTDYSSDTDAKELLDQIPPEWRRYPGVRDREVDRRTRKTGYEEIELREIRGGAPMWAGDVRGRGRGMGKRKRRGSDSEVVGEDLDRVGEDRTNSLPRMRQEEQVKRKEERDNRDELRHWLKKLDRLSFELQDFNHKGTRAETQPDLGEEPLSPDGYPPPVDQITHQLPPTAESYTSDEYRSWIESRRLSERRRIEKPRGMMRAQHRRGHSLSGPAVLAALQRDGVGPRPGLTVTDPAGETGILRARPILKPSKRPSASALPGMLRHDPRREPRLTQEPLQIRVGDFFMHGAGLDHSRVEKAGEGAKIEGWGGLNGLLKVHVYCGHGLKAVPRTTAMRQLYCVLSVDSVNRARTGLRRGVINFDWDEDFEVDLLHARKVAFSVYSWEGGRMRQQLRYSSALQLRQYIERGQKQQSLALRLDPTGTLYVELTYLELHERFQRKRRRKARNREEPGPASPDPVFGCDLAELVTREGTRTLSPILVRRCVEDVELRGLDNVGLYRLCGSAKRQRQLMNLLETDVRNTRLSPTGIPDISIITGVLKSFLQDLPEPLITNDLHPMIVDAFSVRLVEDPGGSAHLMLNIIHCLPKHNLNAWGLFVSAGNKRLILIRHHKTDLLLNVIHCLPKHNPATFRFLMNHLRGVAKRGSVNKMSASALGQIFGPLLLYPTPRKLKQAIDIDMLVDITTYLLHIWPDTSVT